MLKLSRIPVRIAPICLFPVEKDLIIESLSAKFFSGTLSMKTSKDNIDNHNRSLFIEVNPMAS